jgi:high-affinity iron transporter
MDGYDYLSEHERWSLAFWVLSLRHRDEQLQRGERLVEQTEGLPTSPQKLSSMSDNALREALAAEFDAQSDRRAAMAFLRASAPFRQQKSQGDTDFALARKKLEQGVQAYREGDRERARSLFISAYLDGFEPHEPGLRARNAELVGQIEQKMLSLREATASGKSADDVAERADAVAGLLDRARGGELTGSTAALGSAAIALREGFEAVLLIVALLAVVRKRGSNHQVKYVHAGWLTAIAAGLLTWFALGELLGGLQREMAEGIIALVAAVVLLTVTHWIVGQATARKWMGFVSGRLGSAAGRASAFGVFGLAFIAVYREAFETVLFYKALLLDAAGQQYLVWLGALGGIAVLAIVALVLKRIGQRLKPRPFMLASSALLALLALVLVGKGVHALQEAGALAITSLPIVEIPSLGFFASVQSVLAQAVLLVLLATSAVWPWLSARRASSGSEASPAE